VSVSGYQNPIEYQMYSAFENKEEDTAPLTTPQLTTTQPIATTTTAPSTTQLPRSSLDILQSAGLSTTRLASDILKGEGITSAKDVLRSMYFEKPEGVLEGEGISAASILEDYRKEQAAFKQRENIAGIAQKAEADLRKKEEEYIKNFKYEQPEYNPYKFNGTKFGDLDFKGADFRSDWGWRDTETGKATYYSYKIRKGGESYVFMPEDFAIKGVRGENGDYFNTAFLNTATWEAMLDKAQAIDASSLAGTNFKDYILNKDIQAELGRGFLFKEFDWLNFKNDYLDGKFNQEGTYKDPYLDRSDIRILGIANVNGKLVYVKNDVQDGRTTVYNVLVDETGYTSYQWHKEAGGLAGDIARGFAKIPFGAELAFFASGGNPAVYASFKALETAGKGGTLKDLVKASATAYVTSSFGNSVADYGASLGASIASTTGMNAAVANTIGTAVVQAGFNGFIAAATGQDVGDAMLSGVISGGIGANSADITNAIFGGASNVATLSKTLNLSVKQTQAIFTGAIASGAVNSIVKNQSFMDAFTESLIVQGVSQSGANLVGNSLKGTLDPKAIQAVQSNTRIFLQATARAAVRGEDINTAIARIAPYLQGRAIGQTLNILATKEN